MKFTMTKPCTKCPFRTDVVPYLNRARVEEIAHSIADLDQSFPCHKTTEFDGDGEYIPQSEEQHCAGAMILLEKYENPNQLMRIAERIGCYDMQKLDMDAPVFDTWEDMADHHGGARS